MIGNLYFFWYLWLIINYVFFNFVFEILIYKILRSEKDFFYILRKKMGK